MKQLLSAFILLGLVGCSTKYNSEDRSLSKDTSEKQERHDSGSVASQVHCSWQDDQRQIQNISREAGGCQVVYRRGSEEQVIAHARHELDYCDQVIERTRANLANAGFNCRSGSGQKVVYDDEREARLE